MEGVIGAEYKHTINNYIENNQYSKPKVNFINKHSKDVERIDSISKFSIKTIKIKGFVIDFKSLSKVENNTTTQNVRKIFRSSIFQFKLEEIKADKFFE